MSEDLNSMKREKLRCKREKHIQASALTYAARTGGSAALRQPEDCSAGALTTMNLPLVAVFGTGGLFFADDLLPCALLQQLG